MIQSLHNHTKWSDGALAVPDFVAAARDRDVRAFGLSDHFILHPRGKRIDWSLPTESVDEYVREILSFKKAEDMDILLGLEIDWFEGHGKVLEGRLRDLPLDYRIGGIHFVGDMPLDSRPEDWQGLADKEIDRVHREYWGLVREMAESGLFHIAAHLDLPKKFGFLPGEDLSPLIREALDALSGSNMILELNTSGWFKPCNECYPSPEILKEALKRDIPVMLSSDAHHPDHLFRAFGRAARLLKDIGYTRIAQLTRGQTVLLPLEQALDLP